MGGLFLCSILKSTIQDAAVDHSLRMWLYRYYGSSLRAIYTLFEVTLAGCWPNYFRRLIEDVNGWYAVFAVVYITIVVFAIIRIITALFLKKTLTVAGHDQDMQLSEQRVKAHNTMLKLE